MSMSIEILAGNPGFYRNDDTGIYEHDYDIVGFQKAMEVANAIREKLSSISLVYDNLQAEHCISQMEYNKKKKSVASLVPELREIYREIIEKNDFSMNDVSIISKGALQHAQKENKENYQGDLFGRCEQIAGFGFKKLANNNNEVWAYWKDCDVTWAAGKSYAHNILGVTSVLRNYHPTNNNKWKECTSNEIWDRRCD